MNLFQIYATCLTCQHIEEKHKKSKNKCRVYNPHDAFRNSHKLFRFQIPSYNDL